MKGLTHESVGRPILLHACVRRQGCAGERLAQLLAAEAPWSLHVTYRQPEHEWPEVTAVLPLSDEFAAFQIDLYLRAAQRGDRAAARLLFAALHEEWGRTRLAHRNPAWDALFSFLAPLATEETIAA